MSLCESQMYSIVEINGIFINPINLALCLEYILESAIRIIALSLQMERSYCVVF